MNARVANLLSVCRMTAIKVGDKFTEEPSSDDYDEVVFTQNVETIEAFSSHVVQVRAERAHTGDSSLPQGITVQNMYRELRQDSKNAVVVVRNSTAYPQTLCKKTPVARAVIKVTDDTPFKE